MQDSRDSCDSPATTQHSDGDAGTTHRHNTSAARCGFILVPRLLGNIRKGAY
ncbi:uncharacterized protein TRAVEDRAFT_27782, partial [Trametes versicolor FP-101664 SS1]|uniref:uncharacterized protein n=1 Tax=Trametes versicolor (strain FP-101664) TaxID=717944 RepID=UPI00046227C2